MFQIKCINFLFSQIQLNVSFPRLYVRSYLHFNTSNIDYFTLPSTLRKWDILEKIQFFCPLPPSLETNHVITSNTSNFLLLKKWKKKKGIYYHYFFLNFIYLLIYFLSFLAFPLYFILFFFFLVSERIGLINISWQSVAWLDGPTRKDGRMGRSERGA